MERTGQTWDGPDVEELKKKIWQDFHHTPDLMAAGKLVDFLPDACVDDFSLHGSPGDIVNQLQRVLNLVAVVVLGRQAVENRMLAYFQLHLTQQVGVCTHVLVLVVANGPGAEC